MARSLTAGMRSAAGGRRYRRFPPSAPPGRAKIAPVTSSSRAPRDASTPPAIAPGDTASLLTLRQAAQLSGVRRRALRERVRRGQLAVRVLGKGRGAKLRVTADALAAAGLLPDEPPDLGKPTDQPAADPDRGGTLPAAALLELVREQNVRIATLEEQRFQLAGQLGAALERVHGLEARILELAPPRAEDRSPRSTDARTRVAEEPESPPTGADRGPATPPAASHAGADRDGIGSMTGRPREARTESRIANHGSGSPRRHRRRGARSLARPIKALLRRVRAGSTAPMGRPSPGTTPDS